MSEKTRYSDAELEEFRQIINEKLEKAYRDYDLLKASIMNMATMLPIHRLHLRCWKKVLALSPKKRQDNWRNGR